MTIPHGFRSIGLIWVCIFAFGCTTTRPTREIEKTTELPSDLPKELREQFMIEPTPFAAPSSGAAEPQGKADATATRAPEAKKTKSKKSAFEYPVRRTSVDPIWVGEKQHFEISYFGVVAGSFTLSALPFKEINKRKVYHIHGHAQSTKFFSLFYRLDDVVESFFDYEGLFSHRFHLILDESKQTRNSLELYDSEKRKTYYWNRWNHHAKGYTETKQFFPMDPFPQDSISALYYIRTQPLPDGALLKFTIMSEGKPISTAAKVLRRETVDTPMGRKKAIVIQPETGFTGVLKKEGESFIWLTDDDRRFILRLEAKVRIGKVVAVLKSTEPGTPPSVQ